MTNPFFAAAGVNVHERLEAKSAAEKPTAASNSEPLTQSFSGFALQLKEAGVKALTDVASKHGITPEAMKDVIAATLQAVNPNPSRENSPQAMPSLEQMSFSPTHRSERSRGTAERTTSSSVADTEYNGPTEWKVSYNKGVPNYDDGRNLLHGLLRERSHVWKHAELSPYFQVYEFKYNPADDTFIIKGRDKPLSIFSRLKKAFAVVLDRYPANIS